jgi:hypothetical protein
MTIKISPKATFKILLAIIFILVFAGIIASYCRCAYNTPQVKMVVRLFDLDGETNFPAFYSSLALLFSSLLLFYVAFSHRDVKRDFVAWLLMALGFLFLSLDEAAMLHEMLAGTARRSLDLSGLLYNAWVIPYGIIMILGGILYLPFLLRLPKPTLLLFVVSGVIFVSGAVGVEMFEGKWEAIHGTENMTYDLYVAVEEFLEMFGVALFIYALLRYIADTAGTLAIKVTNAK